MIDNPDFDLDSALLEPVAPAAVDSAAEAVASVGQGPSATPEPVVVIQYRNRGMHPVLMLPVAMVVTLALLFGYHAYVEPIVRPATPLPPSSKPAAAAVASADDAVARASAADAAFARDDVSLPLPLTLDGRPAPSAESNPPPKPAEAVVATPAPEAKPTPAPEPAVEEQPRISIASGSPAFADPAAEAEPEPQPEAKPAPAVVARVAPAAPAPLPTQEEMMERIRQEAELKAIQRAEMERRQEEDLERIKLADAQRIVDERDDFRHQLRVILKSDPAVAGKAIEDLCDQFGRSCDPGVREHAEAILIRNKGRLTSDAEVRILRALGLPEPAVLDFLCNRLNRSLHARGGPRSPDEARVVAARQLLRIPATAAAATPAAADSTPAAPPSPARSPIYRRSSIR